MSDEARIILSRRRREERRARRRGNISHIRTHSIDTYTQMGPPARRSSRIRRQHLILGLPLLVMASRRALLAAAAFQPPAAASNAWIRSRRAAAAAVSAAAAARPPDWLVCRSNRNQLTHLLSINRSSWSVGRGDSRCRDGGSIRLPPKQQPQLKQPHLHLHQHPLRPTSTRRASRRRQRPARRRGGARARSGRDPWPTTRS